MLTRCLLLLCVWSFVGEQVTAQTCKVPHLAHGRVRSWQRKRLVKYSCYPNYDLIGERYSSCVNGHWDMPMPICIKPSTNCPAPKLENGYIIPSKNGAWLLFFCLPHYKLEGSPEIYCDGERWNDTAPQCVKTSNPTQLSCDFEDPNLCGWTQDVLHDFDWLRLNKKTPSSFLFTGPSYDHTYGKGGSGYYMYIESTSRLENDTARLISPIYEAALAEDGCFSFFYHMFGRGIGGLRVYQKPDYVKLKTMLSNEEEKSKYELFKVWGSQGDEWYGEVLMLKNFSDNFQIVIEGIRGRTFTSDIAIDDVAILQGSNCTKAKQDVTTPSNILPDSCEGRCTVNINETQVGCSCHVTCFINQTCCHDFFDICFYNWDSTMEDSSQYPIGLPQTEKLVNNTTRVTSATKVPINTTYVTGKKTTAAPKITSTTTAKTTTITTRATTRKPTTKLVKTTKVTTTDKPKATVTKSTTTVKATVRQGPTKSTPAAVETFNRTTLTTKSATKVAKAVTVTTKVIRRTTVVREEAKAKAVSRGQEIDKKPGSSAWKPLLIIMAVLLCCGGLIWTLVGVRGARGRAALDYLRGRTVNDPEVRYLHSNDEDETSY